MSARERSQLERLERLVEASLAKAEADAAAGNPPPPVALGTLYRLVQRLEDARELQEANKLARG